VTSEEAAKKGLSDTLFGKLIERRGDTISSMLRIQYRMNKAIMQWASDAMYDGLLLAHESVAEHRLSDIVAGPILDDPILFIDTAGCDLIEAVTETGCGADFESRFNEGEAQIALKHARELVGSGLPVSDCAIITPYNGQVDFLRSLLDDDPVLKGLEIGTVDSFQGREKEAIIISFVRSNAEREIGFLSEIRRTNVAVTRARRHVCLIGDGDTLGRHKFYKNLIGYVEEHGVIDYPV
jgi:superfamily I DNA and/or RNA helicase